MNPLGIRPLVSVIMASYNAQEFVAAAIGSILNQTYDNLELVVVDDSSSDSTAEIVRSIANDHHGRISLVVKPTREGPCRARNDALSLARGPLISWMDDDDLWLPEKVARQVEVFQNHDDVGLVYTYFDAFKSESGALMPWPDGRRDLEGDIFADLFAIGCFIGSLTAMFRRDAMERRVSRLRESDFSFGDDYHLWLAISLDCNAARIPEVLARYRRHPENESARLVLSENVDLKRVRLLEEFLREFPDAAPRLPERGRRALAWHYWLASRSERQRRRYATAFSLAVKAASLDPVRSGQRAMGAMALRFRRLRRGR